MTFVKASAAVSAMLTISILLIVFPVFAVPAIGAWALLLYFPVIFGCSLSLGALVWYLERLERR